MENNQSRGGLLGTVSYFVAWIIAAVGSIIDALLLREAVLALLAVAKVLNQAAYRRRGGLGEDIFTNFGLSAIDNVFILILGIAAITVTIWSEYYFRKGRPIGQLYKRIAIVLGAEIGVIILAVVIIEIAGLLLSRI